MTDRPNIIVFFSDQQRWDTCGCYGQRLPISPNLDRVAGEGVRFESAFTCQPVCGPARSCLQTGKWATETGCFTNNRALPLDEPTMARWMAEAGYETSYLGKWHLASDEQHNFREAPVPPERRGGYRDFWLAADVLEFTSHPFEGHVFDGAGKQVDFAGYRVDRLTDMTLDYLSGRDWDARPLYLFISHIEPHHQNDMKRFVGPEGSAERWADYEVPGDLVGTEGDWRENFPDYLGCCWSLDQNFGRIERLLAERGQLDNTLLIYTSDHGCHFCTRNSEYKRSCHDNCLRIPMVLRGPGFTGGQVRSELASLMDLPPTILAAAGVPVPKTVRGRPLQDAVAWAGASPHPQWPQEVFAQISESQVGRCIRTDRWKYSVVAPDKQGWSDPDSDVYVEEFLYDLPADPHEKQNLVADPRYADVRAELAARLKRRMVEAGEEMPEIRQG
ncbi:MAG: sulfatase-like hydrolase/transferase [Armatimonadetes bacterium]|nr:sulfatase-like hydrolase/transferase [Armatimonadota bacterium]